ncbi:hypothetical protein BU23DRAFT_573393 [Bimuria novae-zelandiae CBS 107.79]|uniref:Uncharacterized protein n=1 Tax=Bimuria novae-zelandiae CBS 107.79 TaxID=1447943 RepID=A0A6A5UTC3_9PLEO|nr:hypothetical protein BU23DRAFT_573393 [Bimuria novae-zelandiae CBS 107.79]
MAAFYETGLTRAEVPTPTNGAICTDEFVANDDAASLAPASTSSTGLRRIYEVSGLVSVYLTGEVVLRLVKRNRKAIWPMLVALNLTGFVTSFRPPVRLDTNRYQIDVNTELDDTFINQAIRDDNEYLNFVIDQWISKVPPHYRGKEINWISMIALVRQDHLWYDRNHYPRTNYITLESLHTLVICAALIFHITCLRVYNHTTGFARLLSYGEQLLSDAQRQAQTGDLSHDETFEHYRVLNWNDDNTPAALNASESVMDYSANEPRVHWVVALRRRTREPHPDPLGRRV